MWNGSERGMTWVRLRMGCGVMLAAVVGVLAAPRPIFAIHPKIEFDELVHASDVVIVGQVEALSPQRAANGRSIVTDVVFRVHEVVHRGANAAPVGEAVVLTYLGGAMDGVELSVSDAPHFEIGGEYILFARHDGENYINPLVGGPQGMFRIVRDVATGEAVPLAPGGLGVKGAHEGSLDLTNPVSRVEQGDAVMAMIPGRVGPPRSGHPDDGVIDASPALRERVLSVEEFKAFIRAEAARPMVHQPVLRRGEAAPPRGFEIDAKRLVSRAEDVAARIANAAAPGAGGGDLIGGLAGVSSSSEDDVEGSVSASEAGRAVLCWCGYFDLLLTLEQVPRGWDSWEVNDNSMAHYNRYMDIYRFVDDDGTFGDNNENEFCGWVTNEVLRDEYDESWGDGIALTLTWAPQGCPCCEMSQADIMFNPAFTWVYSFEEALGVESLINYRPVVTHELGHSWGLQRGSCNEDYSYTRPTVMQAYYWNVVEDGLGIHSWDAKAIRDDYRDQTVVLQRTDLGIESYRAIGGITNAVTDTDTYEPGDPIIVSNFTVENMSTRDLEDVRFRLWLSRNKHIDTNDYRMGSYWEYDVFQAEGYSEVSVTTRIPDVPSGDYYVGLMVTRSGNAYLYDDYNDNNTTFLYSKIRVNSPPENDESERADLVYLGEAVPFETTRATTDGLPGVPCNTEYDQIYNDVWFGFIPICDGVATATVCNAANFNTVMMVYYDDGHDPPLPTQMVGCNDDQASCGVTSAVRASVMENHLYLVRIGGHGPSDRGTGTFSVGMLCQGPCFGDGDFDRLVSFGDIIVVLDNWGMEYPSHSGRGDTNQDGMVDFNDITTALAAWGTTCQ